MDHNFISVDGVKLAYIEKNKEAPETIFFIHGNSVSKRSWRKQYNSEVLAAYRMIAIDLPAHGNSEPCDIDYSLPALAKIMYSAVNALADNKPYILAGISLSTNIVVEMLAYNVQPKGIVLAGPCIVGDGITVESFVKPATHVGVVFTDNADEKDVVNYCSETSASRDEEDIQIFVEDYKSVVQPFRSKLALSIAEANYSNEIALLKEKNIPCLILFGKEEKIVDTDYLNTTGLPLWDNEIYKIENASHLVNIDEPDAFNNLLAAYAKDIFR